MNYEPDFVHRVFREEVTVTGGQSKDRALMTVTTTSGVNVCSTLLHAGLDQMMRQPMTGDQPDYEEWLRPQGEPDAYLRGKFNRMRVARRIALMWNACRNLSDDQLREMAK